MTSRAKRNRTQQSRKSIWGRGKWWLITGGVAAAIAILFVLSTSLSGPETSDPGVTAPDATLATLGGELQLSAQRGNVLLLYFSFPGCPTCALEAPALAKLQEQYRDRGLQVVAVNIQPEWYSLAEWRSFWKSTGAGDVVWAQDVNGAGAAIRKYRLVALGTEIIVNRQGRITFRSDGPSRYDKLRSEVEKVL